MKISVVMATYNGAEYLEEQLDTIRLQTREADELIACDDGSTDDTVEVFRRYTEKYGLQDKWHITVNERNLGYANNFNMVTLMATGDLIFFSDQDDLWNAEKIQTMTDIMEQTPSCMVLCTDYEPYYTGENAPAAPKKVLNKMPNNGVLEKISLSAKSVYIGALGCCMCVRREFYHSIREYWFDGWAQDDRMWRLAQCVDGCYILHSNLIKHRIHQNNTSTFAKYHTVERRVRLFQTMLDADCMMEKLLKDRCAASREIKQIQKHIKMMRMRIDLLNRKRLGNCIPLVSYLGLYQEPKSYLVEIYIMLKKN